MRDGVAERIQLLVRGLKGDTVLLDFLFRPLALRDVAEDAGKEGVTASLPACEGKFQGELGSLFSLPCQLDRPPNHTGFSCRKKPRKSLSVRIVEPLRHEERERPADHVARGIAEHPLRPWVEVGDVSTFVCGHDGIGDRKSTRLNSS